MMWNRDNARTNVRKLAELCARIKRLFEAAKMRDKSLNLRDDLN